MLTLAHLALLVVSTSGAGPRGSAMKEVWSRSGISASVLLHPEGVRLVCPLSPGTWPSTALLFGRYRPIAFALGYATHAEVSAGHLLALVGVGETEAVYDIPGKGTLPYAGRLRATWEAGAAGQFATCIDVKLEELDCALLPEPCVQIER